MPLASDFEELLEVAIVNNLSNLTLFNLLRYNLSMDELKYHYQALQRVANPSYLQTCSVRCQVLYRRCLASAMTQAERERCQALYHGCLQLCKKG
jgi:hypothetical protein